MNSDRGTTTRNEPCVRRPRPAARSCFIFVPALLVLAVALVRPALAQDVNPSSLYGRDTTQGVYVRDSAVAVEKFALAQRMEHLREWEKAADVYMEILKTCADRVVPSQVDPDNKIYQYASVTPAVQERLAKWPEEGLALYRARYEAEAAAQLDAAGDDLARLHRVFWLYFVTDAAKRAGIRLSALYFERGEFPAAAWTGDRLLSWHPSLSDDRPKVLYLTALAYHLSGNDTQARSRLDELAEKFPRATGVIRGADTPLADSLSRELASSQTAPREFSGDSWPMAFGSPDRARVPAVSGFGGARLFGIDIARTPMRSVALAQRREIIQQNDRDRASGLMTGIFPVVDRGEMFFQDNARVYAVNLESGLPLPGWADTYDGERNGRFAISAWPTPRSQQCNLAVTDESVLAVMGQSDLLMLPYAGNFGQHDTRLVCLDRRTGRQKWTVYPRQAPDSAAVLRNLDLFGSPLVVGNNLYVQARGGKGLQFEDSYVLAFELATGNLKWSCYLASANTGTQFWDGDINGLLAQNVSHLAYSSGRLYALTNVGAAAAVDAYDGTIVWLNIYPRDVADPAQNIPMANWRRAAMSRPASGADKPWNCNPVIVSGGKVFVLPSDGLYVHIYDAGTGIEVNRIQLSQFDNAQTLLGVSDEKLVLCTDRQVFCIDWPRYDPNRKRIENLVWATNPLVQRGSSTEDTIQGRGFVTADSVIIPTAWQLLRLSLRNGMILQSYPPGPGASWGEDEGPGNVLVTPDRLIIAGPARVNVYTDLALAMSRLDAAVAASPDDPQPRLRYAEIMFVAGKLDVALARLDDAIRLLHGAGSGHSDEAAQDRVFTTALSFAGKLAKENRAQTTDITAGLFDRAGAAASTASQKVNYRLARAAFARQISQPDQELKLYQEILSSPDLRSVPVADANGDATAASALARRAIDDVIRRAGRDVYAPCEKAAADRLAAAKAAIDPDQLQSVAQVYPNSGAAFTALLTAADIYEAANNPRGATQVLRQAYPRCTDDTQRLGILESLARNYLLMPNRIDVAVARLNQGVKSALGAGANPPRLTKPLALPDGSKIQDVTFAQAAVTLQKFATRNSSLNLPDIALPPQTRAGRGKPLVAPFLAAGPDSVLQGVSALLVPSAQFARNDRIVVFAPGAGLRVFSPGATQPLFTSDVLTQPPTGVAWTAQQNLLVWSADQIVCLSPDHGQVVWTFPIKTIPQIDILAQAAAPADDSGVDVAPGADAGDLPAQAQQGLVIVQDQVPRVIVRNGQPIIIQPGARVRVMPGMPQPLPPRLAPPRADIEQLVHVRPLTDRVIIDSSTGRVAALDLDSGKLLWQTRLGDRAATHLLASDDFVVARTADEDNQTVQLAVFDSFSGQVISRRSFGADAAGMVPLNLALAADGTLVYLLPDRLCFKDLFEPGGLDTATEIGNRRNDGSLPFQASTLPDYLQVSGDRIFVVADNGATVRMYSLHDGSLLRFSQNEAVLSLGAGAGSGRVLLRVCGSRIYFATPREIRGYDLDHESSWSSLLSVRTAVNLRDVLVTRGHVIALVDPAGPAGRRQLNKPVSFAQIDAFSRATIHDGSESGWFEHQCDLTDASSIIGWQPVDGGFYYLSADQSLHFLRGARKN